MVSRTHFVYTSSAILTAWYLFIKRERLVTNVAGNSTTYVCRHINCPTFFPPILPKSGMFQENFVEVFDIRFYVNPCRGSYADTCRQTDTDGQTLQPMHGDWLYNSPSKFCIRTLYREKLIWLGQLDKCMNGRQLGYMGSDTEVLGQ
jgi:hypothetical protein